jgi:dTDP-4-amino-4,6-dideoxygalactose transaminase
MSIAKAIPFLDLITPHEDLREELCRVFQVALSGGNFIGGPVVESFERDFAAYCDARYGIGVSSGTDALTLSLVALGIGPGDIVVTVPNTFIATCEAISQCGAQPDFVDVDERTSNMDVEKLREYLELDCRYDATRRKLVNLRTGKTVAAIIPIHLYGQMADMDPILALAERYGLVVIEDACQAHGAEYLSMREGCWKKAGSMGKAAAFSFYPGKNLGACGEGGAITTNDETLARKIRMLRDHGQSQKYHHDISGYNGRLDAIQAGILGIKLKHLPRWTEQRRAVAARYGEWLGSAPQAITLPSAPEWVNPVYHLYVVRVADRVELMKHMASENIGTAIHYPIPLHLQKAYSHMGYQKGQFPVTEKLAGEIVSLPMYPQLTIVQQRTVVEQVLAFVQEPAALYEGKAALYEGKVAPVGVLAQ